MSQENLHNIEKLSKEEQDKKTDITFAQIVATRLNQLIKDEKHPNNPISAKALTLASGKILDEFILRYYTNIIADSFLEDDKNKIKRIFNIDPETNKLIVNVDELTNDQTISPDEDTIVVSSKQLREKNEKRRDWIIACMNEVFNALKERLPYIKGLILYGSSVNLDRKITTPISDIDAMPIIDYQKIEATRREIQKNIDELVGNALDIKLPPIHIPTSPIPILDANSFVKQLITGNFEEFPGWGLKPNALYYIGDPLPLEENAKMRQVGEKEVNELMQSYFTSEDAQKKKEQMIKDVKEVILWEMQDYIAL